MELEQQLRSTDDVEAADDKVVEEWFSLVQQKNQLFRQVSRIKLEQATLFCVYEMLIVRGVKIDLPSLSSYPHYQESDLVYQVKDLELIEQHDELEAEIRRRLALGDDGKSEMERVEEEAMIVELVELVERRDQLLWALHLEKTL